MWNKVLVSVLIPNKIQIFKNLLVAVLKYCSLCLEMQSVCALKQHILLKDENHSLGTCLIKLSSYKKDIFPELIIISKSNIYSWKF